MDAVRFGLSVRALRRRRGWSQDALSDASRVSQPEISRLERGQVASMQVGALERVAAALGARTEIRLLWQGELLDRLLDEGHARIVEAVVRILREAGWEAVAEATFAFGAERGSVDVLAWHPATRSLLIVEVKTVVPDLQAMFASLDRKLRLAARIAARYGWSPAVTSGVLVLPEDSTARRRVATHRATFDSRLPDRTVRVRRWIASPVGPFHGLWFLSSIRGGNGRHRVARRKTAPRS